MAANGTATLSTQEQLQARLSEPRTAEALNRLLDRLDVLAFSVEMVDSFLHRGNEVVDSVADSVAEVRQLAGHDGADFLERIPALARAGVKVADKTSSPAFDRLLDSGLLERLAEPRTIENLKSLLDQLELAAFTLQALDGFLARADVIADSISDSVTEIRESDGGRQSVRFVEQLPKLASTGAHLADVAQKPEFNNLLSLVDKVGKPETIEKLGLLLDNLDLAVFALNALDGVVRRGPELTDAIAAGVGDLRQGAPGLDTERLKQMATDLGKLLQAGQKLASSGLLDKLDELADTGMTLSKAGMFDHQVVATLGEVGRMASQSYAEARKTPTRRVGALGLWRLLNDPEAQPALSLFVETVRRFGAKIK